jgi:protein SCO1
MMVNRRSFALCLIAAAAAGCAQRDEPPPVGGPFQLTDQNGRAVDQRILEGKWSLVFFGFTYCPDVCPTALQTLAQAEAQLGRKADKLQVVFISVDPERDTPQALKSYLASDAMPRSVIGLTGTDPQLQSVAKAYKAYFRKASDGPGYQVEHTSAIYLMNPKGRFDRVLAQGLGPDEIARQISDAMR